MMTICQNCFRAGALGFSLHNFPNARRILPWVIQRAASTLPFSSDRDPTEADKVPIHKYIGKSHKRKNMVFVCGLNTTGALGLAKLPKMCWGSTVKNKDFVSYPYRLALGEWKVTTIDCGYGYTVLGSDTKDLIKVYATGINTESQLGWHRSGRLPSKDNPEVAGFYDFVMEPSPVPIPLEDYEKARVVQVACGRAHTLILTDTEGVFSFGNNAFGQCGRKIIEGEIYKGSRKVHQIPHSHFNSPVTQVSCGMDHSLFLTAEGQVYSCGWGADGQTGLGTYERTGTPTQVKGELKDVKVKKVSTFCDMNLAIGEDGSLYGWGNSEYFQLGSVTDEPQVNTPQRLPFERVGKVVDAASGGTICCLLNKKGEVWVWGYGILGKGPDLKDAKYPQKVPMTLFGESAFNSGVKVTKVKCGMHHFAAVTNQGELYTWGKNKHGCLGIAENRNQFFPWKVLIPGEIFDVSCGVDHTVIMAKSIL